MMKMNKNNDIVVTVFGVALSAPLFLLAIAGCAFNPPEPGGGPAPMTSVIFCDIEKGRECATPDDVMMGVNLATPDEDGFWNDKKAWGLDYSAAATGACGGMPQKVLFAGPFPDGVSHCLNPELIGPGPDNKHQNVTAACIAFCDENDLASDCNVARASHRSERPFLNACTADGIVKPDFRDERRLPMTKDVIWTNAVNVQLLGNTVRKTSATPAYDAGAAASSTLKAGVDGAFEFTASETDKERAAGFARGPLPDNDASDADILYRVVLRAGGVLEIVEQGQVVFTDGYESGSRVRIVVGNGRVHYYLKGRHLYSSLPIELTELRVSVSLLDMNATILDARTTF